MLGFGQFGRIRQRTRRLLAAVGAALLLKSSRNAKTAGDAMLAMLSVGAMAIGYLLMNLKPSSSNVSGDVCTTLFGSVSILTRVDMDDGKRYFGCLLGDPGGCSCCAPGNVLEFMPKDIYAWPTNFPPSESRITVTGRLKMAEVGPQGQTFSIPRLVDADMDWKSR